MDTTPTRFTRLFTWLGCMIIGASVSSAAVAASAQAAEKVMTNGRSRALVEQLQKLISTDAQHTLVKVKTLSGVYRVKLYERPSGDSAVIILLSRGTEQGDKDVEVLRITSILVKGTAVAHIVNDGDFAYQSKPDEKTPFIIALDRSGLPPVSKKTYWPMDPVKRNQSIGVALYDKNAPRPGLNDPDWPCKDGSGNKIPKIVSGDADTIWFSMCPNNGAPQTITYTYELRARQKGVDFREADTGIDPLIYNRP